MSAAALQKFFSAAGLEAKECKAYAAKCVANGYTVSIIASATVEDLVSDLGMLKGHARAVLQHHAGHMPCGVWSSLRPCGRP